MQGVLTSLGFSPRPAPRVEPAQTEIASRPSYSLKLVNETVTDRDLTEIQKLGITIISGEWGIDDASPETILALLDRVATHRLKLIINFSDGAAWGYQEDGSDSLSKPPRWQGDRAQEYVQRIKHHPAIFGYDISNEGGENLPNGERFRLTVPQLQQAARDVRAIDPVRPIILRMHYWDNEDGDFTAQNPFAAGIADIVMLNLYSNYTENGRDPALPNIVPASGQLFIDKVKAIDPNVRIWLALAAFRESPQFLAPSAADLARDITAARTLVNVENIGFFGWGPERYPTAGKGWYLPHDGPTLLETIRSFTAPRD